MALVKCYECGADVSESASACPSCGAGLTKKARAKAEKLAKKKEREEFLKTPAGKRQQRIGLAVMGGIAALGLWMCSGGSKQEIDPITAKAVTLCRDTIAKKLPSEKPLKFGKANNFSTAGKEYFFAWGNDNSIISYGQNDTATANTASCTTNADGTAITSLTINGKDAD